MSYSLGAPPPPEDLELNIAPDRLPADVAPTLFHDLSVPPLRRRGWVAVPTNDMREYVKAQFLTAAAGFVVGVGIGAALGNILKGHEVEKTVTKVVRNAAYRRRASTRRRRRGRPTAAPADVGPVAVSLDGKRYFPELVRGEVRLNDRRLGSVFDLGTSFRAIPRGGEPREYDTVGNAVKHVLRAALKGEQL